MRAYSLPSEPPGKPNRLTFHQQFSQEGYDTGGRKISGSELVRASGLLTCPSRGKDGGGQLVDHAAAEPAALALCIPEARGPQGRQQEPGAVSARVRDLWRHLRLRHPPPVQVRELRGRGRTRVLTFPGLYVAHQAPLCMGFSKQEHWSELPCPPPGDLPNPGIKHSGLPHCRRILNCLSHQEAQ